MSELQDPAKLKLNNCVVRYYNDENSPKADTYGTSISIEINDENRKAIEDYWKVNKIGKNGDRNQGIPNIKEAKDRETGEKIFDYLSIKFDDNTQWAGIDGLSKDDMGRGARVNLILKCWSYNKVGGGVMVRPSAIVVLQRGVGDNGNDLAELLEEAGGSVEEADASNVPF